MNTSQQIPCNVLVTGVGAIIGQGIIKSLRNSHYVVRVVGIDRSDQSPGPSLCDVFYKKPACDENESSYLDFWLQVLKTEKIDVVLPGLEVDVFFLDQHREFFEHHGTPVVLNRTELIALSSDKWLMGETLERHGLPKIPSAIPETWNDALNALGPPPFLLKPRKGNGSRGIVLLCDEPDFLYWRTKIKCGWMLQRIVGTEREEYTVGLFGFGDGTALEPIIFRRRLSGAGNTMEAKVVKDLVIEQTTTVLTELFRPLGPTNYQFRKEGEIAYLLDLNPRFSSSNSIRTAFGYNEAEMSLDYFLCGNEPLTPKIRQGIAWRYSEDFVIYDRHSI